MYYEVINNNKDKWIVLLHCICANMHIFDDYIDNLSKKYNILLIDLPGHGNSKDYKGKIEFKEVAHKIVEIVDNLNIQTFTIWGISLGSIVSKYLLDIIPHRIEKIIFEGPAFGIENKLNYFLFILFNKIKYIIPKSVYLRAFIFAVIPGKKRKNIRDKMYKQLKTADYKKLSIWLSKLCEDFKVKDYTLLNNSKVDKCYLLGEEDYIFKKATINNIIDSKYNVVTINKNCGHLCHLEIEIKL